MYIPLWFVIFLFLRVLGYWYFSSRKIKALEANLAEREEVVERLSDKNISLETSLSVWLPDPKMEALTLKYQARALRASGA